MAEYSIFDKHPVHYVGEKDEACEFFIIFEFGPDRSVDLGDGEIIIRQTGRARFELMGEEYSITASGEGPVQLVYRLMTICGSWLLRTAETLDLDIYQYEPGDSKEPLDFFK